MQYEPEFDVDDHCRGIAVVLDRGRAGEVYSIGGGTELANRDLTQRLRAACGVERHRVDLVKDRKGHDRRYSVDITKFSEDLGYTPSVPFDRRYTRHRAVEAIRAAGLTVDRATHVFMSVFRSCCRPPSYPIA